MRSLLYLLVSAFISIPTAQAMILDCSVYTELPNGFGRACFLNCKQANNAFDKVDTTCSDWYLALFGSSECEIWGSHLAGSLATLATCDEAFGDELLGTVVKKSDNFKPVE